MLKEVLTATLMPRHRDAGLYLDENEDFLYLKREGIDEPLASWWACVATVVMVRDAADTILEE